MLEVLIMPGLTVQVYISICVNTGEGSQQKANHC